jgi:hypothetical protein
MNNKIDEEKITQALLLSDYAMHLLAMLSEKDNQADLIECIKNPSDENMQNIAMRYVAPLAVEYIKRGIDINSVVDDDELRKEMKRFFELMDEFEVSEHE